MKKRDMLGALLVCLGLLIAPAAAQSGNLLINGSMDGSFHNQDGIPEIKVHDGWRAWWVEGGGAHEYNNLRPEFDFSTAEFHPGRVKDGAVAMRYFKGWATYTAGAYQVVGGLTPGSVVEFTAWGQSWSCLSWSECHEDREGGQPPRVWSTADPNHVILKIGIDPYGGTDVNSPNVIWSNTNPALDQYVQFRAVAEVQADHVTAFLYATQTYPAENQDTYWDAAVLRVIEGEAPPPPSAGGGASADAPAEPAAPSGWVGAASVPTYEPQEDGRVVHKVRSGETLGGIAVAYGISVDDIRALNGMAPDADIIRTGQELVIKEADAPPAEEPTEAPPAEEPADAPPQESMPLAPTATPAPASDESVLCVSVFEDADRDGVYEEGDALLAGGEVRLEQGDGTVLERYSTSGLNEPHCFEGIEPGMYQVAASAPAGYAFTRSPRLGVALRASAREEVAFGAAEEKIEVAVAATPAPSSGEEEQPGGGLGDFLSKWIGLFVIAGCVVVMIFWGLWQVARRR